MADMLPDVASHLRARRDAILLAWRQLATSDARAEASLPLSRRQFEDNVPDVLDALEERLRQWRDASPRVTTTGNGVAVLDQGIHLDPAAEQVGDRSTEHGRQRWQQGYQLPEVIDEWKSLDFTVLAELDRFEQQARAAGGHRPSCEVMGQVRRLVLEALGEGMRTSVKEYLDLRQTESEQHAQALQFALDRLNDVEKRRARLWAEAAHDLRGTLGVVVSASEGLGFDHAPEVTRERFLSLLQRNVGVLHELLEDLLLLTRLQARQPEPAEQHLDASALMCRALDTARANADARAPDFIGKGPSPFHVQADPRWLEPLIVRLVMHAMRSMTGSTIELEWGESRPGDEARWMASVRFQIAPPATATNEAPDPDEGPVARAIDDATRLSHKKENEHDNAMPDRDLPDHAGRSCRAGKKGDAQVGVQAGAAAPADAPPSSGPESASAKPAPPARARQVVDGISLNIIKRMSDVVGASVEIDTTSSGVRVIRLLMPCRPGMTPA